MLHGFEANLYLNTGTAAAPLWSLLDVAGEVVIDDGSDEAATTTRRTRGDATAARSLALRSVAFSLLADDDPPAAVVALLDAALARAGVADFFLSDSDAAPGAAGLRLVALPTLADRQPIADCWRYYFEAVPTRSTFHAAAGIKPLGPYIVPAPPATAALLAEWTAALLSETGQPLLIEG